MLKKILSPLRKVATYLKQRRAIKLIRTSGLFNETWYLSKNPDVAQAKVDPLFHYLQAGGFEGRDPGPDFSSSGYLGVYEDVKSSGTNPLVHYLKYGRDEGRERQPLQMELSDSPYTCSVCGNKVKAFLPINPHLEEISRKYGVPFTFDDAETINPLHYECPSCSALDRDRLYALYLKKALEQIPLEKTLTVLDIAPSGSLKMFLQNYPQINYRSADKFMQGVDLVLDITDMSAIDSGSIDFFICSHVLEHVADDQKALSELHRILAPGGFGILMVPIILTIDEIDEDPRVTDVGERWRRFGRNDHVRLYSKRGFLERVEKARFIVTQFGVDFFGADVFSQYGISKKSVLYIVKNE